MSINYIWMGVYWEYKMGVYDGQKEKGAGLAEPDGV